MMAMSCHQKTLAGMVPEELHKKYTSHMHKYYLQFYLQWILILKKCKNAISLVLFSSMIPMQT